MSSIICDVTKGAIFTSRSGGKTLDGDAGRSVTFAAQGVNTIEAYAKTGFVGSKAAGKAASYIDDVAKTDSIWGKSAKCLKWAQTHVNPIIGVCAAVKVATADDKERAFCTEFPGFVGMLAAESLYKKGMKTAGAQKVLASVAKSGGKHGKILAAVVEGVGFAAASIGGYCGAAKVGESIIDADRASKFHKNYYIA